MANDPTAGPTTLVTADGERLEAAWSGPPDPCAIVVLTHPHPRHGGDMHNVVPATLARTLPDHGLATVRINFRAVGGSTGTHGNGVTEMEDVLAAVDAAVAHLPGFPVAAVGYSFGADVLLAVDDHRLHAVVAVAPPLSILPVEQLRAPRGPVPTLLLSPEHDQFRTADDVATTVADWPATATGTITGTDHFLAGAMGRVEAAVVEFLDQHLP